MCQLHIVGWLLLTNQMICFYLAATLSRGLVAVFMESPAGITVTGSTHGTAPPALRTRLLHSDTKDNNTFIKATIIHIVFNNNSESVALLGLMELSSKFQLTVYLSSLTVLVHSHSSHSIFFFATAGSCFSETHCCTLPALHRKLDRHS